MTTKDYLSQIGYLATLIENKTLELGRRRALSNTISAPCGERVQASSASDRVGNAVVGIVALENEIQFLQGQRDRIIHQVESVKNPVYYEILADRYINGSRVIDISHKMHYTMRHTQRLVALALDAFDQQFGEEYIDVS